MRFCRNAAVFALMLLGVATPASADITGFLGATATPSLRTARGLALSGGFLIVGFEFEFSDTTEDRAEAAPGVRSGMLNVQVQTPIPVARTLFYATVGGGLYRETLGAGSNTNVGTNIGAGAKIRLTGPIRLRLDYRVFKLRDSLIADSYHRVYAGLNLTF